MIRQVGRAVTARVGVVVTPRAAGRVLTVRIPEAAARDLDAVRDALAALPQAHTEERT